MTSDIDDEVHGAEGETLPGPDNTPPAPSLGLGGNVHNQGSL